MGTVWYCYDGLNRKIKLITGDQCSTSPTLATWSYDSGTNGQGHLSGEAFTSNGVNGTYAYTYDARVINNVSYPFTTGYNDAGMPTSVSYPDGDQLTTGYSSQGWPASVTESLNGTTNDLLSAVTYSGIGGAVMEPGWPTAPPPRATATTAWLARSARARSW